MKNILANSILNLGLAGLSTGLSSQFGKLLNQRSNLNFGIVGSGRTRRRNRQRRRRRRENKIIKNDGIEINKAEGGWKRTTIDQKFNSIGIDLYGRLIAQKIGDDYEYRIGMEENNFAGEQQINIINYLNSSNEFKERLQNASQYKLKNVKISIFNERTPYAGDRFPRLLLNIRTDKVDVQDPKIQSNVMRLNMNTLGTKNFNFNLNKQNMPITDIQWKDGKYLYDGLLYLEINKEDKITISDETETTINLGTVKINIKVDYRLQDYMKANQPVKKVEKVDELEKKIDEIGKKMNEFKILDYMMLDQRKLDCLRKNENLKLYDDKNYKPSDFEY